MKYSEHFSIKRVFPVKVQFPLCKIYFYLGIQKVEEKPTAVSRGGHGGAEPKEDVGCHAVDPKHERQEGVENWVANAYAEAVVVKIILIEYLE